MDLSFIERRTTFHQHPSFPAARHIVNEGPVDIGTSATNGIEQRVRVCDEILFVGELVRYDLRVADVAEHHQAARHANCFSSCTRRHGAYTDPF